MPLEGKKLLDIVRDKIRFKHYSIKTEKSYVGWIKHYIWDSKSLQVKAQVAYVEGINAKDIVDEQGCRVASPLDM